MRKVMPSLREWFASIVREELYHRTHRADQTGDIVRLMLDLHDGKWSIQSDSFLRTLNIEPS
jgi:hypothetical protein